MSLHRGIDGTDPARAEPMEHLDATQEERRASRTAVVASGTLACPTCDAPVAPGGPLSPADPLACPLCAHSARVRDFLSLAAPTRPAHVEVRVVSLPARSRNRGRQAGTARR